MTVAQQLSGPLADELLTSALQAFTSGLNAICLLTAVLSVALAELAVLCASGADRLRIEFRCGGARPVGTFMAGRVAFADPVEADWRAAGVVVEPDTSPSKAVCRELTSTVSLRSDRLAACRRTDSGKCRIPGVVARRTDKRVERERKLL